jgi:hypothetical protein
MSYWRLSPILVATILYSVPVSPVAAQQPARLGVSGLWVFFYIIAPGLQAPEPSPGGIVQAPELLEAVRIRPGCFS